MSLESKEELVSKAQEEINSHSWEDGWTSSVSSVVASSVRLYLEARREVQMDAAWSQRKASPVLVGPSGVSLYC